MTGLFLVTLLTASLFYIFSFYSTYIISNTVMQYVTYSFKENGVLLLYLDPKFLLPFTPTFCLCWSCFPCRPNFTSCAL